ncbi:MAG: CoB--CoM heterodisulfide reductase iron-sulfur subunit B family protein [Deltaproteobacteria bacterium]|nr:CoB--CoM heterodisulfide reductase iron-sulfur subunit B family protein [Deltaproteobacteria bacterium]
MKFALFIGCNIPARVQQYELSTRAVMDRLKIDIVDIREFNCCGYPMRNADFDTYLLFSARNLALAEKQDLDMMTLCKCCYGSLKKAAHLLKEDNHLRDTVNTFLSKEGLAYQGNCQVTHFLAVLHKDLGLDALKEKIDRQYKGLNIATHYGCHALRPSEIMQFDNPAAPVLFDDLVTVTGAKSVDWALKLDCCGAPLMGINDDLSMALTHKKLADGKQAGADYLCAACPWCQLQFDTVQQMIASTSGGNHDLPSILYPQLLGLVMGIDEKTLGLNMNRIDITGIKAYFSEE